jgi:hypothetical protein
LALRPVKLVLATGRPHLRHVGLSAPNLPISA